jgi:hypothetical protein
MMADEFGTNPGWEITEPRNQIQAAIKRKKKLVSTAKEEIFGFARKKNKIDGW